VYFGFLKPVTTVICHNRTVFAGSEDFSVLLYKPNIPVDTILSTSIKTQQTTTNRARNTRVVRKAQTITSEALSSLVPIVGAAAGFVALLIILAGIYVFVKAKPKQAASTTDRTTENETNETTTDLQTVINSVMGISRHAEFLLPVSIIARVKKLTAGGGGEVFIAKVMDPVLSKKYGDTVIQKVVFMNHKSTEESFFQEVGIMIMLSSFPHFCEIIGYTDKPLSMILKYYPDGSLTDWLQNHSFDAKIMVKCAKEISKALSVMHSHYLAHCDIKTQNVLVKVDNGIPSCYLTDFGITQVLSDKILASAIFQVVNLRGISVPYASPEAFINFRSKSYANINFKKYDIYSLSMIMFEVMAKRTPWK
jgi:serine/threonine protein kinase